MSYGAPVAAAPLRLIFAGANESSAWFLMESANSRISAHVVHTQRRAI